MYQAYQFNRKEPVNFGGKKWAAKLLFVPLTPCNRWLQLHLDYWSQEKTFTLLATFNWFLSIISNNVKCDCHISAYIYVGKGWYDKLILKANHLLHPKNIICILPQKTYQKPGPSCWSPCPGCCCYYYCCCCYCCYYCCYCCCCYWNEGIIRLVIF